MKSTPGRRSGSGIYIRTLTKKYEVGSTLVIANSFALHLSFLARTAQPFAYRCFFVEHKGYRILPFRRVVIETLQRRSNCLSIKQLHFPLLVHLKRSMQIEQDLFRAIIRACTNAHVVPSVLDITSNSRV